MIHYYGATKEKIDHVSKSQANWISIVDPSTDEKKELMNLYGFSENVFELSPFPETISRSERIPIRINEKALFLRFNYLHNQESIYVEERLKSVSAVFIEEKLITVSETSDQDLLEVFNHLAKEWDAHYYLAHFVSLKYQEYLNELKEQYQKIKKVNEAVKSSMKRDLLLETKTIEHNLVFLENVLKDQADSVENWLNTKGFTQESDYNFLADTIRVEIRTAQNMVHMYRELVDATSGLLSDIMDNRLNNIMEQLETMGLIIAVPTLIFSLWGINTGGLIGRESPWGSVIVVLLALLLGIGMAIYLKRKEFKE